MATHTPWDGGTGDVITEARLGTWARGWLGYAKDTDGQSTISTETDITGLSVQVTVPADRLIKVTGYGIISVTQANTIFVGDIQQDGTTVGRWAQGNPDASTEFVPCSGFVLLDGLDAGSYTFNLALERVTGSGTITLNADTTSPAYIVVEDLGPSSS
jgi:hypothetical protein